MSFDVTKLPNWDKFKTDAKFHVDEERSKKHNATVLTTGQKMEWRAAKGFGAGLISVFTIAGRLLPESGRIWLKETWGDIKKGETRKFVTIQSSPEVHGLLKGAEKSGGISIDSIKASIEFISIMKTVKLKSDDIVILPECANMFSRELGALPDYVIKPHRNCLKILIKEPNPVWIQREMEKGSDEIPVAPTLVDQFERVTNYELVTKDVDGILSHSLVKKFDTIDRFNSPEERSRVDKPNQQKMTLSKALDLLAFDRLYEAQERAENGKPIPHPGMREESSPNAANVTFSSAFVETLEAVTDPHSVSVASTILTCSNGKAEVNLSAAVAMRKGPEEPATPKAMGEDAFILDSFWIRFQGHDHRIPFAVTMDGSGGHVLAQHGRKHLKKTFETHLQALVEERGRLDSIVISEAMEKADKELFAKVDGSGNPTFSGTGYEELRENHKDLAAKGLTPEKVKKGITSMKTHDGKLLKMNPNEMRKKYLEDQENHKAPDFNPIVTIETIDGKTISFDISDEDQAFLLQRDYEMAMGTQERIEVNLVMNTFFLREDGKLECITYNRGDSMSLLTQEGKTQALSKRGSPMGKASRSCVTLEQGARVVGMCDGVTDVVSIDELAEANKDPVLKEMHADDYVKELMAASILTGSGDDKTILSVQVISGATKIRG